jgi:hypothetical protein
LRLLRQDKSSRCRFNRRYVFCATQFGKLSSKGELEEYSKGELISLILDTKYTLADFNRINRIWKQICDEEDKWEEDSLEKEEKA